MTLRLAFIVSEKPWWYSAEDRAAALEKLRETNAKLVPGTARKRAREFAIASLRHYISRDDT